MADMILKVSETKYMETLNQLQSHISRLKSVRDELESKKQEMNSALQENLGRKAAEMIDANLANVNSSIERTQAAIDQIENYFNTIDRTQDKLSSSLDDAANLAKQALFD